MEFTVILIILIIFLKDSIIKQVKVFFRKEIAQLRPRPIAGRFPNFTRQHRRHRQHRNRQNRIPEQFVEEVAEEVADEEMN